jgi:hypothetical protein
MPGSKATLNYSFGDIEIKVSVDGNIDRGICLEDRMLSAMLVAAGAEVEEHSIMGYQSTESSMRQTCSSTVHFGELHLTVDLDFNLKQHVSKRTLNTIVFSVILPKAWETAGKYLGDSRVLTQKSHRNVLNGIDDVLASSSGQTDLTSESLVHSPEQQARSRQLVGAH